MKTYTLQKHRAFTLIELLVVIAIIGVLSSVVLASLNSARVKARDTRRVADLKQLSLALEFYYDENGEYPSVSGCWDSGLFEREDSLTGGDTWVPVSDFLPRIPKDPINTAPGDPTCPETWDSNESVYMYFVSLDNQSYELLAPLEDSNNSLRCDQACYTSTVRNPGQSWCEGATSQCSNPMFTGSTAQHIYVIGN